MKTDIEMKDDVNNKAREAALAAASTMRVEPTSIVQYESRGVVAVIGGTQALQAAAMMPEPLKPHLLLDNEDNAAGASCTRIRQREISVEGYLGNFTITLNGAEPEDTDIIKADLVLDLGGESLLQMPLKPPGYLTSGSADDELQAAVGELVDLVGTFEKPKYFEYDASICAHGRSGQTACRRCIDVCPADAISSIGEAIEVASHLCQGGGACATACPSGAIRYVYPSAEDTLTLMRRLLQVYRDEGGLEPVVLFHTSEAGMPDTCGTNVLPIAVEELASVGMDVWLSALAYGARTVLLLDDGSIPTRVLSEIDTQLVTATEILAGMGYPAESIQRITNADMEHSSQPVMPQIEHAGYAATGGKRQTMFMAVDALYEQAFAVMTSQPEPMVALTAGAPFGSASINESSCTLCMSCVGVCPGKALQSGQDVPQVRFIESNCLQCGMCTVTCPEYAITLSPRLLFDHEERKQIRTLYEEPPFCCVSCGKPFATRSVIDNMMAKLEGHWMFKDERSKQRLKMCEDCRVVDVVQDPGMMERDIDQDRVTH
jgi:ferredoxin